MLTQTMYQVQVENQQGRPEFIGPAMSDPEKLYDLAAAINLNVAKGQEKEWHNAQVVQLSTQRN